MLTLSGAPDRVVGWFDFSLQHKKAKELNRICHAIFQAFTGFIILITRWSSVMLSIGSSFLFQRIFNIVYLSCHPFLALISAFMVFAAS